MKLPAYQFIAQMSAAFAVVASLGFVAYELKQARDIALAEIYQHKTELMMGLNMALADYPELLDAQLKLNESPEKLEEREMYLLFSRFSASMSYFENNHFLYLYGMVTEEQMDTIRAEIGRWFDNQLYRQWWIDSSIRGSWRASFAAEVDRILAGLDATTNRSESRDRLSRERCLASGKCQAELRL
jgi:hypothetical protein